MNIEASASIHLREITEALAAHPLAFTERDAFKFVEEQWLRLKSAPADERLAFVFEALATLRAPKSLSLDFALKGMIGKLLRGGLPITTIDALRLIESISLRRHTFPYKALLTALEPLTLTPAIKDALLQLRPMIDAWHGQREMLEIRERIDTLVHGSTEKPAAPVSAWTRRVFEEVDHSPNQLAWRALLLHARSLTQSTASRKWQTEAVALIDKIGRPEFFDSARRWLALGPMPDMPQLQVPEDEADYQKGFIWTLGAAGDTSIAAGIADFAFACFHKIPQIGAVSHRVGNACVNALAAMPGLNAVAQISRLSMRVRYDVARRLIEKALVEAAERNNVSRDDLEAMSVPTFEKNAGKERDAVLSTQRLRLERLLLSQTSCVFDNWKAWYIDHPVTSVLAKCLIWEIETGGVAQTAIWFEGNLVDWAGNTVPAVSSSTVRLWHPIRAQVQSILSWRCWLEDHGVRQPFKQAHREVYLLTDAERQTDTYSNRFAAHIVRQHQFSALCRERGWKFNLMGTWDSHNTPTLDLPQHQLRVELHVDFSQDGETSGHGIYKTICTGRVQFFDKKGLLHLADVPPVVLSEVMRDVDLLVGVTSIGADPTWGAKRDDPHAEYWQRYADGELSTSAENRKTVLETLLPKLTIRDRCRLEGRYLIVRGQLTNEYRIHLGSGNVIMEPGSRYLCIVRGPGDTAAKVPLPFEGDPVLAVILSKAFLLAKDKSIKDESIRRQIN